MNFLNNYDANHPVNNPQTPQAPENNGDFMNFLNNYDANHPVNNPQTPQAPENNGDFMNFLNNYDANHPVNNPQTPQAPENNGDFMNFLNNYDANHPIETKQEEISTLNDTELNFESYLNNNIQDKGVMINNVTPPITNNFNNNSYVEDNPNYVDVSKATIIDNVDIIINELKATIEKIKNQSKFKVDTDEIDFDDVYQITIKIDKREAL